VTGPFDLSYAAVPFRLALRRCRFAGETIPRDLEIAQLDFQGSWLDSIAADGARVKGDVFLRDGFHAAGLVRLLGAEIGGDLDCSGGTFENPPQVGVEGTGTALSAARAIVRGAVFLRNGFGAVGEVRLSGAQIGADLDCNGASFQGRLRAQTAIIKAALIWVDLVNQAELMLDLTNATAGALVDDIESWPPPGNLDVEGFVYEHIYRGPKDAKSRLEWLARQRKFKPQPYRQLAKVLKDEGDDRGARQVLFEMECRRRAQEDIKPISNLSSLLTKLLAVPSLNWILKPVLRSYRPVWSGILKRTIVYGYYPVWALPWLLLVALIGFGLFCLGYSIRSMAPTEKDAYSLFKKCDRLPPQYQRFHASVYSLENSLPLVQLGQAEFWQPDPSRQRFAMRIWHWPASCTLWISFAGFLRSFLWAQILLGWILATLFAAGVTGIIRKDWSGRPLRIEPLTPALPNKSPQALSLASCSAPCDGDCGHNFRDDAKGHNARTCCQGPGRKRGQPPSKFA
jgi:hypothetical protein